MKKHYYCLDWLRFLVYFLVLLSHIRDYFFPAYNNALLPNEKVNPAFCVLLHQPVWG